MSKRKEDQPQDGDMREQKQKSPSDSITYPLVTEMPQIIVRHGETFEDSYVWLGEAGPAVDAFDDAQNQVTEQYLDNISSRQEFLDGLKKWSNLGEIGVPFRRGEKIFQWRRVGEEKQPVLYVGTTLQHMELLINPNEMSDIGTTSVDKAFISPDGKFVAFTIAEGGSRVGTLNIFNIEQPENSPLEVIADLYDPYIAWLPDNSGFYYTRLDGLNEGFQQGYKSKVYLHRLHTEPSEDVLVFEPTDQMYQYPGIELSDDNQWLILEVSRPYRNDELFVSKVGDNPEQVEFRPLIKGLESRFHAQEFEGYFYIRTTIDGALNYKIMRVRADNPQISDPAQWEELIPENNSALEDFTIVGRKLILNYTVDTCSKLFMLDLDSSTSDESRNIVEIELPGLGTVSRWEGSAESSELLYSFESFNMLTTIFQFDTSTGETKRIDGVEVRDDLSDITFEQVKYPWGDLAEGTMFIIQGKDSIRDGKSKTIVYGYGGFNLKFGPRFSSTILEWVRHSGTYVIVNLPGDGGKGEAWHRLGMLDQKQNVFDAYNAAADFLIQEGYTSSEHLGYYGGSNGGLTVLASALDRSDLPKAVVADSPLTDVEDITRWQGELGNPKNLEHFAFMNAYFPYQRVEKGHFPATLIQIAQEDSEVPPKHGRKMAAKLQRDVTSNGPILLQVQKEAGHGGGSSQEKINERRADMLAFFDKTLGE